eukprot:486560-Pyramimonas_sp.AAC.1
MLGIPTLHPTLTLDPLDPTLHTLWTLYATTTCQLRYDDVPTPCNKGIKGNEAPTNRLIEIQRTK